MMQSLRGLCSKVPKVSCDRVVQDVACSVSVHVCVDLTLLLLLQDTCDSHQANSDRSGHS